MLSSFTAAFPALLCTEACKGNTGVVYEDAFPLEYELMRTRDHSCWKGMEGGGRGG